MPRETIRDWRRSGRSGRVLQARVNESCPVCGPAHLDEGEYAYLLGLYLQRLFCAACADFGVSWTQPSFKEISVAKARDVARLDVVIGPKR